MSELKTSEVLDLAADSIEQIGWRTGGGWVSHEGSPICLEGGIVAALGLEDFDVEREYDQLSSCPAYIAVQDHLNHKSELWKWNDRHAGSKERVIEALRGAAAAERVKEEA